MGRLLEKVMKEPLLQVALDFIRIEDAVSLLRKLMDLPIGIIEVGTPLIKSEGMKAVSIIRSVVGSERILLADMKTADVGEIEARLASESGADAITALGCAEEAVIESCVSECSRLGLDVVIDLIGIKPANIVGRVSELHSIGVRLVNLHVGIDVQKRYGITATSLRGIIRRLSNEFNDLIISVSGGIKPKDVRSFIECGARIVVIGSAITRSASPRESAIKALEGLRV